MENVHHLDKLDWTMFEHLIPENTRGALERYVLRGIEPGGFLTAVLSNDLKGSFARADMENREALFKIVVWLMNYAPSGCWGSKERYLEWVHYKQVQREQDEHYDGIAEGIRHINEDRI